jgi:hypothetical protein
VQNFRVTAPGLDASNESSISWSLCNCCATVTNMPPKRKVYVSLSPHSSPSSTYLQRARGYGNADPRFQDCRHECEARRVNRQEPSVYRGERDSSSSNVSCLPRRVLYPNRRFGSFVLYTGQWRKGITFFMLELTTISVSQLHESEGVLELTASARDAPSCCQS